MMNQMMNWIRTHGWLLGVLAIASFAMLFRLDTQPIKNWDEGIHGEVSFEMVESGDWLTPHYAGGTYFRKPPLKLWMSAALFEAFGVNAWTLRLPNAIAGILTALLVAWWMWEWRKSRSEAFLAGIITATMRPIFSHAFRTGEMDGMLTLFVVAALYCWWKAISSTTRANEETRSPKSEIRNKPEYLNPNFGIDSSFGFRHSSFRWLILVGAYIGLGIMTKSAAGLISIPIIVVHALFTGAWRGFRICDVGIAVIAMLAIAAPWHLAMTILHGATFWSDYVGWHVVQRVTEAMHNPDAGFFWYIPVFVRRFAPYTLWFVPALILAAHRSRRDHALALLTVWFAIVFIGFTFAKTKFDWYLLPLYPAAVMLVVWAMATAYRAALSSRSRFAVATTIALTILGGVALSARQFLRAQTQNPAPRIAADLRGTGGVIVTYGMDFKQSPAAYFILRSSLTNDVRILDGLTDIRRTLGMLGTEKRPGFLITRGGELPPEIAMAVSNPKQYGEFTLWHRR